jgi:hypothetical protein
MMTRRPAKQVVKYPRRTCCWIEFTSSYQLNKLTPGIGYLVTVQKVNYLVENTYTIWGSKVDSLRRRTASVYVETYGGGSSPLSSLSRGLGPRLVLFTSNMKDDRFGLPAFLDSRRPGLLLGRALRRAFRLVNHHCWQSQVSLVSISEQSTEVGLITYPLGPHRVRGHSYRLLLVISG